MRRFAAVFVAVVVLHALWDSTGTFAGYLVIAAGSLALLGWITHRTALTDRPFGPAAGFPRTPPRW